MDDQVVRSRPDALENLLQFAQDFSREFLGRLQWCVSEVNQSGSEKLENIASSLEDTLCTVYQSINGLRPINRLPAEVLASIFSLVPRPVRLGHRSYRPHRSYQTLCNVAELRPITATCHRWRDIALNTPTLWSTVVLSTSDPAISRSYSQYLHLCTSGPLYVYFDGFKLSVPTVVPLLRAYGERIRTMEVGHLASDLEESEPRFDAMSRHLAEVLTSVEYCNFVSVTSKLATGPIQLFPPLCTTLRVLSLVNTNFIPSGEFPQLTHLVLSLPIDVEVPLLFTQHDIVSLLSGCLRLTSLHLWNLARMENRTGYLDRSGAAMGRVNLVHLQRLSFYESRYSRSSEEMCMAVRQNLLSNIMVPSSCVIWIGKLQATQFAACATLMRRAGGASSIRISDWPGQEAKYRSHRGCRIMAMNPVIPLYASFDMRAPCSAHGVIEPESIRAIATSSTFATIRELWISPGVEWIILPLLPHLFLLETLVVMSRRYYERIPPAVSATLHALKVPDPSSSSINLLSCPALTTLRIGHLRRWKEDISGVLQLAASTQGRPPHLTAHPDALKPRGG